MIIQLMTLGNMRENGVRTLAVWCGGRDQHHRVLDVSSFTDDVTVPSFGPRMVCTVCGAIGADTRPNWNERAPISLFGPPDLKTAAKRKVFPMFVVVAAIRPL